MAQQSLKIDWTDVESSNVQSVAYHDDTRTLCVRFQNGGLYSYDAVDQEVYVDLVHAPSVGKYLNQAIKGQHPYERWFSEEELVADLARKRGNAKGG